MMSSGTIGPYKDYILNFPLIQQDPKRRKEFQEVYPDIWDFMQLRDRKNPTDQEKAKASLLAMAAMPAADGSGPPQWLLDAAGA